MGDRKRIIAAIVDAPEISLSEAELAGDVLINFYRALGWNEIDIVCPWKVRTTSAVYYQLHAVMAEKCPDRVTVGMALVNKGPGVDDDVPPGKVYLLEGWTSPEGADEGEADREIGELNG